MQSYQDGVNADRYASDYRMAKSQVTRTTKLKIHLAPAAASSRDASPSPWGCRPRRTLAGLKRRSARHPERFRKGGENGN